MLFDFHCHTTCSDGTLSPLELVRLAADSDVQLLSITDHDTAQAYIELENHPLPEGLKLVPGIEFSSQFSNRGVHILGIGIDPHHPEIKKAVQIQTQHRLERAQKIAYKLSKIGFGSEETLLEKVQTIANSHIIGRPHFAELLVKEGHCSTTDQAFKQYLGDNKSAFVKQAWPELDQVVHWITTSGGIAAIAHPDKYKMTRRKLCTFIEAFQCVGGEGFEVLCARQAPDTTNKLAALAREYDLYATMGSDFHSPKQTWLKLGMHTYVPRHCKSILEADALQNITRVAAPSS